jgi:hypothetical protein
MQSARRSLCITRIPDGSGHSPALDRLRELAAAASAGHISRLRQRNPPDALDPATSLSNTDWRECFGFLERPWGKQGNA